MSIFGASKTDLDKKFPDQPFGTCHELAEHPLFSVSALAELAGGLDRDRVEFCSCDMDRSQDPDNVASIDLAPAEIVRQIETCGAWMVLKRVESDPRYMALMQDYFLDVAKSLGKSSLEEAGFEDLQGFIFVSSPNSTTPFHVDHEENLFIHLAGDKTMHIFDNRDYEFASDADMEAYPGQHRNLTFDDAYQTSADSYRLAPGEGVFVPFTWPHWVETGDKPAISMQMTWKSPTVQRMNKLLFVNAWLRRRGLPQARPGSRPWLDGGKVAAYTMARAIVEPLRRSERSRRLLRGLFFGRRANYYYGEPTT